MNLAGKEEGLKEAVDRVAAELAAVGGKVETIQKMDKKPFARVADKRVSSGHYVNVIFEAKPSAILEIQNRIKHSEEIFRALFTEAGATVAVPAQA